MYKPGSRCVVEGNIYLLKLFAQKVIKQQFKLWLYTQSVDITMVINCHTQYFNGMFILEATIKIISHALVSADSHASVDHLIPYKYYIYQHLKGIIILKGYMIYV